MRFTASTALCVFLALTSAVFAQEDVHKPHPPPRPPPKCPPCGTHPVCAKGRECVDRRICAAEGQADIICPLDNARRGRDNYGQPGKGDGHDSGKGDGHNPGKGDGHNPGKGDGHNPGKGDGRNPGKGDGHNPGKGNGGDKGHGW
ncbi:hypothetical protein B0H19DRAFT_1060658 [Mycena capillaripes]|nr:hypothetical protein B0H19DRAFT_1060658 [Mycena capillaripes]